MTPKFKVGDKLYLKRLTDVKDVNRIGILKEMHPFFGTSVTIRRVITGHYNGKTYVNTYLIEEDKDINDGFEYDEAWFYKSSYNWEDIL